MDANLFGSFDSQRKLVLSHFQIHRSKRGRDVNDLNARSGDELVLLEKTEQPRIALTSFGDVFQLDFVSGSNLV